VATDFNPNIKIHNPFFAPCSFLVCYPVTSMMHAKVDRMTGKPTFDRAFCVRMKSTLTKRGCHFKSSGYRVRKSKIKITDVDTKNWDLFPQFVFWLDPVQGGLSSQLNDYPLLPPQYTKSVDVIPLFEDFLIYLNTPAILFS
jgi:hypothetical protein